MEKMINSMMKHYKMFAGIGLLIVLTAFACPCKAPMRKRHSSPQTKRRGKRQAPAARWSPPTSFATAFPPGFLH